MGMFDYFKCEYALPDYPFLTPHDLQTKDLDNEIKTYTLKADGRLTESREKCYNCGYEMPGESDSQHTGWVNAYTYQIVSKNFEKQNGYRKGEIGYCLNFNFRFEFSRGNLLSLEDDSYCSVREWHDDKENPRNSMYREIKRLTMEEFIALFQSKAGASQQEARE